MKNRPEFVVLLRELENRLQKNNVELKEHPEGILRKSMSNGKPVYFQAVVSADGAVMRKSLYKNPKLVKALARKAYLEAENESIERSIETLNRMMAKCVLPNPHEIIANLPQRYNDLPEQWFFDDIRRKLHDVNDVGHKWDEEEYEKSDFRPQEKSKVTTRGLHVRSMAELVIAERFYYHEIAFRYEEILRVEGYSFAPDFTVMRQRDGRIFYWEHCGMPHNEDYMRRHKWKMGMYEKAGIVPWENLIVTYSDRQANVDMRIVESEIINKLM